MDSVIKAFFSIKVDFSARTISVRSEGFRRFKEPACSHRKRRVFSCEKCVIKMENILLNLILIWLCCKNAQCMSVSGWSCNGEKKKKNSCGVFCVCVRVRLCSVQRADVLPPSVEASVVLCSRLTWTRTPPPQGSSSSRNDISHQAGEDGVTGNLLLSDRPCHRLTHSWLLKDLLHLSSICKTQLIHAFSVYLEAL